MRLVGHVCLLALVAASSMPVYALGRLAAIGVRPGDVVDVRWVRLQDNGREQQPALDLDTIASSLTDIVQGRMASLDASPPVQFNGRQNTPSGPGRYYPAAIVRTPFGLRPVAIAPYEAPASGHAERGRSSWMLWWPAMGASWFRRTPAWPGDGRPTS